jgi:N-methylhydantoinase A/oxoprolinase/acetone carboxylase beta subunit
MGETQGFREIRSAFEREYSLLNKESSTLPNRTIELRSLRLIAASPIEHMRFPVHKSAGSSTDHALVGKREVYWDGAFKETNIYERDLLKCGNVVKGPAIVESDDTTYVISEHKKLTIDKYLNGTIESV